MMLPGPNTSGVSLLAISRRKEMSLPRKMGA